MAHSIKPFVRVLCTLIIGALIAGVFNPPVSAQGAVQIDVLGARALSDALQILERELDFVITYEAFHASSLTRLGGRSPRSPASRFSAARRAILARVSVVALPM